MPDVFDPVHYQRLGLAVVNKAVHDFAPHRDCPIPPFADVSDRRIEPTLLAVTRRLDAAAFLLERTDPIATLWRCLSEVQLDRVTKALWECRHADLKVFAAHLVVKLEEKIAAARAERAAIMETWVTKSAEDA